MAKTIQKDLTKGSVTKSMLLFAGPLMLGNMLQQLYNIVDTLIVGRCLGADALAAVGSSFTLISFLTSMILGLCMGSGALFSMLFGAGREDRLKHYLFLSFLLIGTCMIALNVFVLLYSAPILHILQVPDDIFVETEQYVRIIFYGLGFTFLYNYFASVMRAVGNSFMPLVFLAVSTIANIGLDLLFILVFQMGISGAAWATIISQAASSIGIMLYCLLKVPVCRLHCSHLYFERNAFLEIVQYSFSTCIQQSIMNFGILMIQGLVNSFGVTVMAAFAAAVKIDAFAYMPVQDFGNAFSTFIAQNFGAGKKERIRQGIRSAVKTAVIFCIIISAAVTVFAKQLMCIFVDASNTEVITTGTEYLRIEGFCYVGIGCLFLLYGLYRGIGRPEMSIVLTVISLGTRVLLAYTLSPIPAIGLTGIWTAIPIGWMLADMTGLFYYLWIEKRGTSAS